MPPNGKAPRHDQHPLRPLVPAEHGAGSARSQLRHGPERHDGDATVVRPAPLHQRARRIRQIIPHLLDAQGLDRERAQRQQNDALAVDEDNVEGATLR